MKKTKRLLALAGAFILIVLYLSTLIFALIDSPWAYDLFRFSVGCTIIFPILLYVMMLIARVLNKQDDTDSEKNSSNTKEKR